MIDGVKPYPAVRDSGVEWLGEVPAHWEMRRLKAAVTACVNGIWGNDPNGRDDLFCVRVADFDRTRWRVRLERKTFRAIAPNERANRLLENGDLLLEKSGGGDLQPVGVVVLYEHDVASVCSNFVARMPVSRQFSSRFLAYLNSHLYARRLNVRSIKQTTGIQNLDAYSYLSERVAFPPLAEQTAIAQFLDHADRRIRHYIRAKEKLIALLEEQKQVIIHQAVTGRIDVRTGQPYPVYKPSGVEWLGGVPEHWMQCRLRNVVSEVTTGSRGWSSYASDDGPLFIRVANLNRGSLRLRFNDVVRLNLPDTSEASRTRVCPGDILLSVTAYIGSVGVVLDNFEEAYVSQHVARCRPVSRMSSLWLGYVLLSKVGQTHGQLSLYGGTKDGLSLDDVKNYPMLVPPRCEQDRIVRWIERELAVLEEASGKARCQMARLREYRTRLIADVVTGKLDVREAAAGLPEIDPLAVDDEADDPFDAGDAPAFDEDQRVAEAVG